jgi:hypothetical protein
VSRWGEAVDRYIASVRCRVCDRQMVEADFWGLVEPGMSWQCGCAGGGACYVSPPSEAEAELAAARAVVEAARDVVDRVPGLMGLRLHRAIVAYASTTRGGTK